MTSREEVARLAGVSPRTVSNVVSGSAVVAETTRDRVLEAIASLNYRPSEIGRMLRTGRTGICIAVLPGVDAPYFAELARCLTNSARRRGYTMLIEQSDGERERERELLARADRKAFFDGLIISPLSLLDDDLRRTTRTERPVVLLGEERHPGFDHVAIDNLEAAREATAFLLARGRRRIVALGAEHEGHSSSTLRLAASGQRSQQPDRTSRFRSSTSSASPAKPAPVRRAASSPAPGSRTRCSASRICSRSAPSASSARQGS